MALTTRQKVAIARVLAGTLLGLRKLVGLGPEAEVVRDDLDWQLDLREGIDLAIYLNRYERDALALYDRIVKPGMSVLDIGANIGFHTLHLAARVGAEGRVLAVEPTDFAFAKLGVNLALNDDLAERVVLTQAMLVASDADQVEAAIYSSWPVAGEAEVHETLMGQAMSTSGARAVTLDRFLADHGVERLDLVKLDVDGHEPTVLAGGAEALKRLKPLLYVEFCPHLYAGNGFADLIAQLTALGYGLITLPGDAPKPLDAADLARRIPHGGGMNVLLAMG